MALNDKNRRKYIEFAKENEGAIVNSFRITRKTNRKEELLTMAPRKFIRKF